MPSRPDEILRAGESRRVALVVVVVAAAQKEEFAGEGAERAVALDVNGPAVFRGRPIGTDHLVVEPDMPVDSIHGRGALDVLEDGLAVGDRLPSGPGTESET